jgi:hypothetical protein
MSPQRKKGGEPTPLLALRAHRKYQAARCYTDHMAVFFFNARARFLGEAERAPIA